MSGKSSKPSDQKTTSNAGAAKGFHLGNVGLTVFLAVGGCAVDLLTKRVLFQRLGMPGQKPPHWIIPEYFGFETSINTGGLFGMFSGNTLPLAVISFFAIAGVLWWLTFGGASRDRMMSVILGMILGGILGNLYDRMGLWGIHGVRDWILFQYEQYVWPNFNIADMLLVCGAALMMYHAYRCDIAERRLEKLSAQGGESNETKSMKHDATDSATATS